MLLLIAMPSFAPHATRVTDVEGARRAAVLAVELRSRKVAAQKVPEELAASSTQAPYDNEPFAWDAEEHAIVFVGLQSDERKRHAFVY